MIVQPEERGISEEAARSKIMNMIGGFHGRHGQPEESPNWGHS